MSFISLKVKQIIAIFQNIFFLRSITISSISVLSCYSLGPMSSLYSEPHHCRHLWMIPAPQDLMLWKTLTAGTWLYSSFVVCNQHAPAFRRLTWVCRCIPWKQKSHMNGLRYPKIQREDADVYPQDPDWAKKQAKKALWPLSLWSLHVQACGVTKSHDHFSERTSYQ